MRFKEIIAEATEREVQQAVYMEGQCGVLAIAIHQYNPQRYPMGYVYEYNAPGTHDIWLDPEEYKTLSDSEQQEYAYNYQNWGLVHAYVLDQKTGECIDARGRHNKLPTAFPLNLTRKNKFPCEWEDIVRLTTDMEWDETAEEWKVTRGLDVYLKITQGINKNQALDYAIKYLGVEPVDKNSK